MTPGSFDPLTAREVVGDTEARVIEAKARKDAALAVFDPPPGPGGGSYWCEVQDEMRRVVYCFQYTKRLARNKRTERN